MHENIRFLNLTAIYFKCLWRKLAFDFIREIVLFACATVLTALFFYIFHDFIHTKIADLTSTFRERFATTIANTLLALTTIAIARWFYKENTDSRSLAKLVWRMGESKHQLNWFKLLKSALVLTITFTIYWLLVSRYIIELKLFKGLTYQTYALFGLFLLRYLFPKFSRFLPERKSKPLLELKTNKTKAYALSMWRLRQITQRNRASIIALVLSFLFGLGHLLVGSSGLPVIISVLIAMFSGLFVATALSFQLESDMHHAWLDRLLTVSHRDYESIYLRLALILGSIFATINVGFLSAGTASIPTSDLLKTFLVTLTPILIFPSIMFQLDPKKPALTIITIFIISLFVSTAIYASLAGIIIIPFLHYYASNYQNNNFYRS